MNRDQRLNPSMRELGSGPAARTASLAADSMITYMSNVAAHSKTNDLVLSNSAPENYVGDDEFRLSTDIDALFFASGSGGSNDGGSDKLSLGDEDENAIKSTGRRADAVPTRAAGTRSTGISTSVRPTYTTQGQVHRNVPQYVGPSTTDAKMMISQSAHPVHSTQQHLMPVLSTGISSAIHHSSGLSGIHHKMMASQPWISFDSRLPQQMNLNQGMGNMLSSHTAQPSTIHLFGEKMSSSQNPTSTSKVRKRGRNSSSANQDENPPFIPSSAGSSIASWDQNIIPENEGESKQRRKDRNLREQMRSQQIKHQISDLKDLLIASKVPCKSDKFSTLTSVYQYIKDLHEKKLQLDEELRYLVQTINQTNNVVHASQGLVNTTTTLGVTSTDIQPDVISYSSTTATSSHESVIMSPVETVDYQAVFAHANAPLAVIHLDGKLIDCNAAFNTLFSVTRLDLGLSPLNGLDGDSTTINTPLDSMTTHPRTSLFHILAPYNMNPLFVAMSNMLENSAKQCQSSPPPSASTVVTNDASTVACTFQMGSDYWSGILYPHDPLKIPLQINISIERNHEKYPKFFNCSLFRVDGLSS